MPSFPPVILAVSIRSEDQCNPYGVDVCKLHFKTSKFEAEQKQLLKSVFQQEADLLCEETKVKVITKCKASHDYPLTFLEDLQDLVNNWLAGPESEKPQSC